MTSRAPLSEQKIVEAAARVADAGGLAAVSMRGVGKALGVEAMSLYHHVANKEALLDALADWVFAQIALPGPAASPACGGSDPAWRTGMLLRARSAREVLAAHPWALGLVESRSTPGPALLRHHDRVIGCLRAGGFSLRLASHAFSVIDAYVYGFVLTEQSLPFDPGAAENAGDFAASVAPMLAEYPHLGALVVDLTADRDYVFSDEFEVGLGMILDQLEIRLEAA